MAIRRPSRRGNLPVTTGGEAGPSELPENTEWEEGIGSSDEDNEEPTHKRGHEPEGDSEWVVLPVRGETSYSGEEQRFLDFSEVVPEPLEEDRPAPDWDDVELDWRDHIGWDDPIQEQIKHSRRRRSKTPSKTPPTVPTRAPRTLAAAAPPPEVASKAPAPAPAAANPPPPKPKPKKKSSLAQRAKMAPRPKSAKEALAEARKSEVPAAKQTKPTEERAPAQAPPKAKRQPSAPKPDKPAATRPAAQPAKPAKKRSSFPKTGQAQLDFVSKILVTALPGAELHKVRVAWDKRVFQALWRSHAARAAAEGDASLAVSASMLISVCERSPGGALVAAEVTWRDTPYAVWLDLSEKMVLAVHSPPELYLIGL